MATPEGEQSSLWTFNWSAAAACPADLDFDGVVTSQDFFGFLVMFFTNAPEADYNRSGSVDSQDFFVYLTDFFTPCK